MATEDTERWNARYESGDAPVEPEPNAWFVANERHIDRAAAEAAKGGRAPASLDLACGAGGTLLWLARRGWNAAGVDASDAALALASAAAERAKVRSRVRLIQADLDTWRPPADAFDCVTCFNFLDRRLWPSLRLAVRPGGLIAMRTFQTSALRLRPHVNPAYLLKPGELVELILGWGWTLLGTGDQETGETSEAVLAQRPG